MPDVLPTSSSATAHTILVVDDDPDILALCDTVLGKAGFVVLKAGGSSDALKLCKTHPGPIHCLLADLVMPPPDFSFALGGNEFPHVHGHDLAGRALYMRNDLRIALMSANIDKELAGYGIRRGTLPFLQKPFQPQALIDLVKQVLQGPPSSMASFADTANNGPEGNDEWFG